MPLFGGPPNVENLKAKRDVKGLIKALGYQKDASVRRAAAEALGELKDARAVEPLIAALKDKDVRQVAAKVLGRIGDARAVEPLIAALKEDQIMRQDAAESLEKIGAPAVEPLIVILKDKDSDVRQVAAWALGQIGDARAVQPLIATLKDTDWDVRKAAAEALDRLGWQPDRSEVRVTYWIAKGKWNKCVEIGAPAVEALIAALKDQKVRKAAAWTLGEIGTPHAVEPLIATLKKYTDWDVRQAAVEALAKIGSFAVEPLIAALKDKNEWVRKAATEALDKLGWQPDRSEVGAVYWVTERQWDRCIEIGAPAVEPLTAALKDTDLDVRKGAARALVRLYHQGNLDEQAKQRILAQRERIAEPHTDTMEGCGPFSTHTDQGTGVLFPL